MSAPGIYYTGPLETANPAYHIPVYAAVPVKGNSATGQNPVRVDEQRSHKIAAYGFLEVLVDNTLVDTGQTDPVAPGSSKTITLKVALSDTDIAAASAPAILANVVVATLVVQLANDATSSLLFRSDPFVLPSRFIYVWQDNDSLTSHSVIGLTAKIVRV